MSFERQLKDITAGRSTGSCAASSAASSEPHLEPARGSSTVHPPRNPRTVLVARGFGYDTETDVICEKSEPGVKDWTPGKVGSVGKVSFHKNDHAWTSSENTRAGRSPTDQRSCGTPGIVRWRKSSSPRGSHWRSKPCVLGGGERLLDEWSRDGHRWGLGTGPCVVHKTEDGGSCHHDLLADQQLLLGFGVHRRNDTGWDEDFADLWIETMDEANFGE